MKALHLENKQTPITVKTLPVPEPTHGSAVVKVLATDIISYHREIYDGTRAMPIPTPLIPGSSCIGRIAAVGPDATKLTPGRLVFADMNMRSRDNPEDMFLSAINEGLSEGSKKLMREVWRDGSWAEYWRVPLENCIVLNQTRLCKELGYDFAQLMYISHLLVAYGGLRDIGLEPGQTVVICPATGGFGGAGVHVAAAMGARVVAMGRNETELARIKSVIETTMPHNAGIEVLRTTGDEATDSASLKNFGTIDAILDFTPTYASNATHTRSAIAALKYEGRVSLMGFADITSSPSIRWQLVGRNITLKGRLMYTRDYMVQFVNMVERGLFPKGENLVSVKRFGFDEVEEALEEAGVWMGIGKGVIFEP